MAEFVSHEKDVRDQVFKITFLREEKLRARDGRELLRLAAQRAFWFGWYAAYPETRLVR